MSKLLTKTFRSVKPHKPNPNSDPSASKQSPSPSQNLKLGSSNAKSWSVYLIISTNNPIKTYVGVTTDFSRRLKQHNGELKGGAKASRAGRPWVCACIVRRFNDHGEACAFESKWKSCSRKMPRKRRGDNDPEQIDGSSRLLLQHRQAALNRVKDLLDCSHLEIDWQLDPS